MTVASVTNRKTFAGDNLTTSFGTSPIVFFATGDLTVYVVTDSTGAESLLAEGTHYDVTGGGGSTGTVRLTGGTSPHGVLVTGTTLVIVRELDLTQPTDFVQNDSSDAGVTETAFDRAAMISQQLSSRIDRSFKLADSDVSGADITLPAVSSRASKLLGFNASGGLTVYAPTTDVALATSVNFTQLGTGATTRTVSAKLQETKSITDYGADTAATAANNTTYIQAAIDANYGKALIIPPGTFNVATTGNTDASTGAVGSALTITDEITLIFEGILKCTNNGNAVHINAGAQDVVTLMYSGGGLEGLDRTWVAAYAQYNYNGALVKVTAGIPRIYQIKLINPVQYAIYSAGADEGHVAEAEIIGGWTTYDATRAAGPDDNNYGIALYDTSTGWKIDGVKTVANAAAGKVSQAVASDTATGLGVANKTQVLRCRFRNQHEKGLYLFGEDNQVIGNHVVSCANGEGIRVIGARPQVSSNLVASCDGGGITLYDAGGAMCEGNLLSDIRGSGITLAYYPDEVIGTASLSHACIRGNQIGMDSAMADGGRGIDVRIGMDVAAGDVASTEEGIEVVGNHVTKANYHSSDPLAAIDFMAYNAASIYRDLNVESNHVNDCGAVGIRFGAAAYNYAKVRNNIVRDPAQSVARSAFVWETGVVWTGQEISGNEARKETGANAMTYGFENKTATTQIQSTLVDNNHTRGHGTAGYLNMTHASNSRFANRMGDNALVGSFTCTAGATTVVTNTNAQAGMRVALYPTNAAAVALQGHATGGLYFGGTLSAGVSFTLASTGGVAAGTETFVYEINV